MPQPTLEDRVALLEQQVTVLTNHVSVLQNRFNWRGTVGMFAGDDLMKEIDEEGRKIREAQREHAQREDS